jgi:hypothetical protein
VSVAAGSLVPVSLTPNAFRHASFPPWTIAIDALGIFVSWSHCVSPFSQPAISASRKASLDRSLREEPNPNSESDASETPAAARPP